MPDDTTPTSAPSAELLLPTRNGRDDETIAAAILRETARMRKTGSFDTHALCWNPEELELLAMYAIDAKDRLSSRSAEDRSDTERETEARVRAALTERCNRLFAALLPFVEAEERIRNAGPYYATFADDAGLAIFPHGLTRGHLKAAKDAMSESATPAARTAASPRESHE